MTTEFHFSLGPVQSFVAQARRTRDLWAGSWLLSYLSENAIAAAEGAGARVVLPFRNEPDRGVVTMARDGNPFGGFPNRFAARANDPAGAAAAAAAAARGFEAAWRRIADAVWGRYVAPAEEAGAGSRQIWERQVESFWEVAWVLGTEDDLAARKRVRLVRARAEPGVHDSLSGELQELSGHHGPGSRERQAAFWGRVHQRVPGLDLEVGERLSAIGLIKRLFPHVSQEAVGCDLSGMRGWPSTAWLAAAPWIERARAGAADLAAGFVRSLDRLRWPNGFRGERDAARRRFGSEDDFASLDGPLFFEASLASPASLGLPAGTDTAAQLGALRALQDAVGSGPEPFYAVLLMDGDRLGTLLAAPQGDAEESRRRISEALARFSGGVDSAVRRSQGYTVYAGGDDLLALLPADRALQCAERLGAEYPNAFGELPGGLRARATISAALVFAHYKEPLRAVLRQAHDLLDVVAKEATGRGALVVAFLQSSGRRAVWAAPWEVVRGEGHDVPPLRMFVTEFGDEGRFNPSYLHNLSARFMGLFDESRTEGGLAQLPPELAGEALEAIARSEYGRAAAHHGAREQEPVEAAAPSVESLLALTRRWRRRPDCGVVADERAFSFDGVRVARLLARVSSAGAAVPPARVDT